LGKIAEVTMVEKALIGFLFGMPKALQMIPTGDSDIIFRLSSKLSILLISLT
jgi:hypothetical protein